MIFARGSSGITLAILVMLVGSGDATSGLCVRYRIGLLVPVQRLQHADTSEHDRSATIGGPQLSNARRPRVRISEVWCRRAAGSRNVISFFPVGNSKTFIRNYADGIAAVDPFVVPTVSFRLLYGLLIMEHGRRQIPWFGGMAKFAAISATPIVRRKQAKGIAQCDAINQALSVRRHMANAARVVRLLIASF